MTFKQKCLTLCFLSALITGGFSAAIGLVSPQISTYYNVDISNIVYIDVLNIVGLLIGNFFSGRLIEKINTHNTLCFAIALGIIAESLLALGLPLSFYTACSMLNGISIGFLVPAVTQSISDLHTVSREKDSKLSLLNFFFSLGSVFVPIVGGYITHYLSWRGVFAMLAILYVFLLICALTFKIKPTCGNTPKSQQSQTKNNQSIFNLSLILIGIALVCYVYIEYVVSYWFSPYLQMDKHISVIETGKLLGIFGASIAAVRLIAGLYLLKKIRATNYITLSCITVFIGFLFFLNSSSYFSFMASIILIGCGCASLFPTLLGYGIAQANYQSPRATSFLITCGSIGGFVGLIMSGFLGQHVDKVTPIYVAPILAFIIIAIIFVTALNNRYGRLKAPNANYKSAK
ncbi:MFS transporter [Piscirickettsia salmonis]|uniref:Inner membrane protein YbjJ n=1 Tax=Piscirickettsia salmonis TaxID=1238 RepID=A0A9Q5YHJ1_PISSA|nr:MFS transporter [Piscirickettsia salmonis]ALA24437.1 major Facilitator Superfamily protein [Piscirickettsia salmonis]APS44801.1 MFS transporter [Piscirickettsia salmonis]APS48160.1 MFS transporter [Piscirickettsia salmonis]APS56581.1 MFS transporter [Piscirickettsia salmonis]ERL61370.1 major Facilitator Superfamily protein [Piscirickettsia salmonis LF-89 = ATCC VR-1361]